MAHIGHSLSALKQRRGQSVVTVCGKRKCRGDEFVKRIYDISAGLRELSVTAGERVALVGLNSDLYLEWLLAVPCAGAIIAPLNHRWSMNEAVEAVNRIEACLLVFDDFCSDWWAPLAQKCPSLRAAVRLREDCNPQPNAPLTSLLSSQSDGRKRVVDSGEIRKYGQLVLPERQEKLFTAPDGTALICFTSGTTGAPKAAVLSHGALVTQSMAKLVALQYNDQDVYLHAAPLCHIGGISSALGMLMAGATHVFLPRWRVNEAISAVQEHHVTTFIAVPAMLSDLIFFVGDRSKSSAAFWSPFSNIRTLLVGGRAMGAMTKDVIRLFPNAIIATAYGMTEAASSITFDIIHEPTCRSLALPRWISVDNNSTSKENSNKQSTQARNTWTVCVGRPAPHLEIRVANNSLQPVEMNTEPLDPSRNAGDSLDALEKEAASSSPQPSLDEREKERLVATAETEAQLSSIKKSVSSEEACFGPPFREGVIEVRGPNVFSGYYNQPEETAKVLSKDGWFRTGDLGYLDNRGRLWLCGREKDMVKTGGENVHAAEVEAILTQHPAVSAAAVVGLPDARLGERVAALLVLKDGWTWGGPVEAEGRCLDTEQMRKHCNAQGLSRYKTPLLIAATSGTLPVTSTGKVQKNLVRQELLKLFEEARHSSKESSLKSKL